MIFKMILPLLVLMGCSEAKENQFVVVVPSFNNSAWYQKNLDSIFSQTEPNYRVIYVDDQSSDGTADLVEAYVKEKGQEHRFTLIRNTKRVLSLANLYTAISLCDPLEIVVELDGDDWFPHPGVLSHLAKVYKDPNVWVTYGQFQYYPDNSPGWASEVPIEVIRNNGFREHTWSTTALRTFYATLFQRIKKEDLMCHGKFYAMAGDLAHMFPITEMAGEHILFIPDVLYIYNVSTQVNDGAIDPEYQQHLGLTIRDKEKYPRLNSLY